MKRTAINDFNSYLDIVNTCFRRKTAANIWVAARYSNNFEQISKTYDIDDFMSWLECRKKTIEDYKEEE